MRGRKPATDISTTRTRPRTPKATAERKAAEHLAGRVFSLHGGEVKPEDNGHASGKHLAPRFDVSRHQVFRGVPGRPVTRRRW